VTGEQLVVLGVADRVLRRRLEEVARIAHQVLVELVLAADHHHERRVVAAARPPRALIRRHPRAGVAVQNHGVEPAHVDAEFEGARGPHPLRSPAWRSASISRRRSSFRAA